MLIRSMAFRKKRHCFYDFWFKFDSILVLFMVIETWVMPVILLYGIYGGVTTPTEAAAVAAFYALMLAAMFYRAISLGNLYRVFVDSARSSASPAHGPQARVIVEGGIL